jgi:hypothetical protein
VLVDERVRQLPLGARELNAVALDRAARGARLTELLPFGDEIGDPSRKDIDWGAVPAAPETRRAQGTKCWAACHAPSIGSKATKM